MRDDGTQRDGRSRHAARAVILIRLLVGLVFFEEGVQKFLFPALMGAGRFARIGIPAPEVMGPSDAVVSAPAADQSSAPLRHPHTPLSAPRDRDQMKVHGQLPRRANPWRAQR